MTDEFLFVRNAEPAFSHTVKVDRPDGDIMKMKTYIITAAGGNGTAIKILKLGLTRERYAKRGKMLGACLESYGAEQVGFLVPSENRFEMAGGEFCGNAARSAAILLSRITGCPDVQFTMSGYEGAVKAKVDTVREGYFVVCAFDRLPLIRRDTRLMNGRNVSVVDMGGIVHVVVEASFPNERAAYEIELQSIILELKLADRSAVGVLWVKRQSDSVFMYPVVWVKEVRTCFFEQSCGSGTIAVGLVTGAQSVIQPTGQKIEVEIGNNSVTLRSEMEVVYEN